MIKRKSLAKKKNSKITIEGVFFKKVISHKDKRGFFRELFRSDDKYSNKNFSIGYLNLNSFKFFIKITIKINKTANKAMINFK